MNLQSILTQIGKSTNPMQMMMNLLNTSQKEQANQFQTKSKQEQAQMIADLCNQKGISKDDLSKIINGLKG